MQKTSKKSPHNSALQKAAALLAEGKGEQALEIVQKHLRLTPRNPDALNMAGKIAARMENWALAEKHFSNALSLNPNDTHALYGLSEVFKLSNRVGEAIEALTRLLRIEPRSVSALNEIGFLLAGLGHLDPALKAFEAAIEIDPSFEQAYRNLYTTLFSIAHFEEAAIVAKRAMEHISPEFRWNVRATLILCLWKSQAIDEAKQVAEELINELDRSNNSQYRETLPQALNNYGVLLMETDEPDAAETQLKRAIVLAPELLDPYINLARLNGFRENFQEAINWFDKALVIDPGSANLHSHLANFLRDAGRPDLALPHNLSALSISPGNMEFRHSLSHTQFALGQLHSAYENWEFRWLCREAGSKIDLPIPEWTGAQEAGRSLLVYREQGIGDQVIFASCLPDIITRFERILCVCHSKLKPLFARSFPQIDFRGGNEVLSQDDLCTLDCQIAMGSLPRIVRPNLESFPKKAHFLVTDPEKVAFFHQRLPSVHKALRIGFGWRSHLLALNRRMFYPGLEFWQPLFDVPGVIWINLQYGDIADELEKAEAQFGIHIINFEDVDHFNDLDTSAALMKACDLVIGPSTSTTMISAAVGVPTIRLAPYDIFQLGTDYYPWLPSLTPIMRNFGEAWDRSIQQTADIVRTLATEQG